jgi:putative RNA 2'-phosphotransferase
MSLDVGGYADLHALAAALAAQPGWDTLSASDLMALAAADPRRYEVRGGRIRARYGHTVSVEAPGEPALPPEWLYIGVDRAELQGVCAFGLRPSGRQLVHLSTTPLAAADVARRRATDAVIVVVFARRAADAGVEFRRAGAGLYLTARVPAGFIQVPD